MSILFTKETINTLELPNRIVRSAAHEGLADERGRPTQEQFAFYRKMVEGGVGLLITGYAGIMQEGKSALYHMTMIDSDELLPAHREMVRRIHDIGGRIVLQIAHCGRQTWSSVTGLPLKAPSAIACGFYRERPLAMTEEDISQVIKNFALAARRAQSAGYDGVEIHGAHGYLLSTFLSRHANRRTDRWGGSRENRFRIVDEVLKATRKAVGAEFPILLKMNTFERHPWGIKTEDCLAFSGRVEDTGCCDAIDFSCGTNEGGFYMTRGEFPTATVFRYMRPFCNYHDIVKLLMKFLVVPFVKARQPPFTEGYNLEVAARVKKTISLPVITVGGMRSRSFMEDAITEGKTDFISMARPLIREPDLPNKFKNGVSERAQCNNCNDCVVAVDTRPIQCYETAH